MRVGFTGPLGGMTHAQRERVRWLMLSLKPSEVRHGDAIGADAEFHDIALMQGVPVVLHPSTITSKRAYCQGAREVKQPNDPLTRNGHIVQSVSVLIAAPATKREVLRSGTWSTIRRARKRNRLIALVYPDGTWKTDSG